MRRWNVDLYDQQNEFELKINAHWQAAVTGIFGHNGSGKSTLLRQILGIGTASSAQHIALDSACFVDRDLGIFKAAAQRQLSWIPQDIGLLPHFTVAQNITFGQKECDTTPLHQLDLARLLHRFPFQMSRGEQQRVAIARALWKPSQAILADEPFSALDRNHRHQAWELLIQAAREESRSLLVINHNWNEIATYCDHVLILDQGQLVYSGRPETAPGTLTH